MDIKQQVAEQRTELEQAVSRALEIAAAKSDAAEVAITKSTGLSVSTRMGDVETLNSTATAHCITVYRGQRKGSASTSDLSEAAIEQTVLAALDIAQYTSEDPFAGPAPKEYMVKEVPDLDLFHPDAPDPDYAAQVAIAAEKEALNYSDAIKQSMVRAMTVITALKCTVTAWLVGKLRVKSPQHQLLCDWCRQKW